MTLALRGFQRHDPPPTGCGSSHQKKKRPSPASDRAETRHVARFDFRRHSERQRTGDQARIDLMESLGQQFRARRSVIYRNAHVSGRKADSTTNNRLEKQQQDKKPRQEENERKRKQASVGVRFFPPLGPSSGRPAPPTCCAQGATATPADRPAPYKQTNQATNRQKRKHRTRARALKPTFPRSGCQCIQSPAVFCQPRIHLSGRARRRRASRVRRFDRHR